MSCEGNIEGVYDCMIWSWEGLIFVWEWARCMEYLHFIIIITSSSLQ